MAGPRALVELMDVSPLQRLDQELGLMMDAQERLTWIASLGKRLDVLPAEHRLEEHVVAGCVSLLWLQRELDEQGRLVLRGASDSPMVQGLLALLLRVAQGQKPAQLPALLPEALEKYGVLAQLTPNRRRGLAAVWGRIVRG